MEAEVNRHVFVCAPDESEWFHVVYLKDILDSTCVYKTVSFKSTVTNTVTRCGEKFEVITDRFNIESVFR